MAITQQQASGREAELLSYLAVKSMASAPVAAAAIGCDEATALTSLRQLADRGLADERRLGFRLTEAGIALVARLRSEELAGGRRLALDAAYQLFEGLNDRLLVLATDWQVITIAGRQVPNEHTDPAYDAKVIDRLFRLHAEFLVVLEELECALPRLGRYRPRFENALLRIGDGDHEYVTRPDREAYHTLWFELHEELLQLLGRKRKG